MEEKKKKKQEEKKKKEGAQKKVCACFCFQWLFTFVWGAGGDPVAFSSVSNSDTSEQSCRLQVRLQSGNLCKSSCDSSLALPKLLTISWCWVTAPTALPREHSSLDSMQSELDESQAIPQGQSCQATAHCCAVPSPASLSGLHSFHLNHPLGYGLWEWILLTQDTADQCLFHCTNLTSLKKR